MIIKQSPHSRKVQAYSSMIDLTSALAVAITVITIYLQVGSVQARFNSRDYYPYYYRYPWHYPSSPLTSGEKRWVIDRLQRNELPIVNPRHLDPNILMICDDQLSPDDIYTGLMAVLVRVEDTLRRNGCSRSRFAIHRFPVNVHTLLGKLRTTVTPRMQQHPYLGTYLDTMQARASQLIRKAENCQLDYVLLMKVIRMSMKLLVNKIMCGFVEVDVLRNRYGWPPKYGTGLPYYPSPYHGHVYPYARRYPFYYYPRRLPPPPVIDPAPIATAPLPVGPVDLEPAPEPEIKPIVTPEPIKALEPKVIPALDKGMGPEPVQKWPYYPPYAAPGNPYLGALGPDGKPLNGIDSGCKACDKNRDVILG